MTPRSEASSYSAAGVDYTQLDEGKRQALTAALATSDLLSKRGGLSIDASRGEPAFVFEFAGQTLAFVLEGLGTKAIIARQVYEESKGTVNLFDNVAYDTVAAIVNDLCCVGAVPLVVNAYFATGSSDWYEKKDRQAKLIAGWQQACVDAGATWGGGESPSLPELVEPEDIELAGSAVGVVPDGRAAILGEDLSPGDEIVFVASAGLHANGSSLARLLVDQKLVTYSTPLPGTDTTFGAALLDRSVMYVDLVKQLVEQDELAIRYLSHITGHGLMKLMRPAKDLTYEIHTLPEVPPVLRLMADLADMDDKAAYSTFNMGCGFAIYCGAGDGEAVADIARQLGHQAHVAGVIKEGPRQVVLLPSDMVPKGVVYGNDAMDLTPDKRAA